MKREEITVGHSFSMTKMARKVTASPATRGQSPTTSVVQAGGKVPGQGAVIPKKVPVNSVSMADDAESVNSCHLVILLNI